MGQIKKTVATSVIFQHGFLVADERKNKISETFPQFFLSNKYQSIEEEDEIPFSNSVRMNCTDMHNEIRKDVGTWQIWQAL